MVVEPLARELVERRLEGGPSGLGRRVYLGRLPEATAHVGHDVGEFLLRSRPRPPLRGRAKRDVAAFAVRSKAERVDARPVRAPALQYLAGGGTGH